MAPLRMRSTHPTMSLSSSPSPSSTIAQQTDSHTCDTLPRARPSSPSLVVSDDHWSSHSPSPSSHPTPDLSPSALSSQPTPRKLCIRHQRIADEGTNLKLQQVRPIPLPSFQNGLRPLSYYVSWTPHFNVLNICVFFCHPVPRPSTTFLSEKENPSMQSGQAFRHLHTLAESLFFGAS
jgi:hypothetical protein